jgi:hypothetical protein
VRINEPDGNTCQSDIPAVDVPSLAILQYDRRLVSFHEARDLGQEKARFVRCFQQVVRAGSQCLHRSLAVLGDRTGESAPAYPAWGLPAYPTTQGDAVQS